MGQYPQGPVFVWAFWEGQTVDGLAGEAGRAKPMMSGKVAEYAKKMREEKLAKVGKRF